MRERQRERERERIYAKMVTLQIYVHIQIVHKLTEDAMKNNEVKNCINMIDEDA